jgi:lipoyl-dependent peroxiredoxin subunit D
VARRSPAGPDRSEEIRMTIDELRERLPEYAKDTRLNLGSITGITTLTEQQLYGTMLSSALASRDAETIAAVADDAVGRMTPAAVDAARAAASIMAMSNVYYRFLHLVEEPQYASMPIKLRMQAIGAPGVDKIDFELWCIAVSAINGCGSCVTAHERKALEAGASREMVQDVVRIASVVHAAALTVEGERALAAAGLT